MKCFRNQLGCDIIKRLPFLVSVDCVCLLYSKRKETLLTSVITEIEIAALHWVTLLEIDLSFFVTRLSMRDNESLTSYFRQCITTDRSFCIVMDLDIKVYLPGCSRWTAWWELTKIKQDILGEKCTWSPVNQGMSRMFGLCGTLVSSIFFLHKCCLF